MRQTFGVIAKCLLALAIINFVIFAMGSAFLGGDAFNGKIEQQRYYLSNHGRYSEVSKNVWYYSYYHSVSVMVTHTLGMGAMGLYYLVGRPDKGAGEW